MLRSLFQPALALIAMTGVLFAQTAPQASPLPPEPTPPPAAAPKLKASYSSIHTDQPIVALTFDDGPHKTLTPELLDLLAKRNVKATFFVLGSLVATYPEIAQRIVKEGHEIANHTWSHPNLAKMGDGGVRDQFERTRSIIHQTTGVNPTVMRPPYGAFTERQRSWALKEFGYPTIMWDVDPLDWRRPGASVVAQRILDRTRNGSIILVHDIHPGSIEAMPRVIDTLLQRGYRFLTVSELLKHDQPRPASTPRPPAPGAAAAAAGAASGVKASTPLPPSQRKKSRRPVKKQ